MTDLQRLRLRGSEIRSRLLDLGQMTEPTDENRAELDKLTGEYQDIERRSRALEIAGDGVTEEAEDSEGREFRQLQGRVTVGNYIGAALEMRGVLGAEAEFNAAAGIGADGFPLRLLAPEVETRATTDTDTTVKPSRWLDRLFADAAATRLGVTFEPVGAGVASFPITTAGATGAQRGRAEAVADAAWTVGVSELKPTRHGVRGVFVREDAARLPGLEDALRRDLRMALADSIDKAVFLGDDGANEAGADITGLMTAADITEKTLKQVDKVKGPETLAKFAALVDGVHAAGFGDLRIVATVGAWRLWESTVINSTADNMTMAAFLRAAGLSWSSRGGIETDTAADDFGAFIGRGRGIAGAGVAAVWDSASLIRDPYSGAAKGEVSVTLNYLWGLGWPRPANYARVKFVA